MKLLTDNTLCVLTKITGLRPVLYTLLVLTLASLSCSRAANTLLSALKAQPTARGGTVREDPGAA